MQVVAAQGRDKVNERKTGNKAKKRVILTERCQRNPRPKGTVNTQTIKHNKTCANVAEIYLSSHFN